MAQTPEDVIRDEIRALGGYPVPDATGMVKLDAMENPYPLPAGLRPEIARLVESASFNRYPDSGATRLKARLREVMAVPPAMDILVGNGSDELIQALMLACSRPGAAVMGLEPSFVMFRLIAAFCGMRYVGVPLREDFALDADRTLEAIDEHRPGLIIIAFPNNPTGNLFDPAAIERIVRHAPGLVVVDEAYHAFAGKTFMPQLTRFPNLLVMRTLSKLGLAALRLGMLAGARAWLEHLDKVRLPYNVNVLTQLIAEKVLQHHGLLAEQAASIRAERGNLHHSLQSLPGVEPYISEANFILFRVLAADAVFDGLKARRVLIKNLHGSHPMLGQCLRVTVGTPDENARFLGALKETLAA
ncbi:MAG: histidinol-phosphate transaminase [Betaproteobacteria bacterium]